MPQTASEAVELDIQVTGLKAHRTEKPTVNKATVRNENKPDIILRPDLRKSNPGLQLLRYVQPRFLTTELGVVEQKADKDDFTDRFSDSDIGEHTHPDTTSKLFDFQPKTPLEADIQRRVNSVPSLRSLNELRRYKLGVPPDEKFRMALARSDEEQSPVVHIAREYLVEQDRERRERENVDSLSKLLPRAQKTSFAPRPTSPLHPHKTADSSHNKTHPPRSEDIAVRPYSRYENSVRVAVTPQTADTPLPEALATIAAPGSVTSSSAPSGGGVAPIYTPATFRIPAPVSDSERNPYEAYAAQDPTLHQSTVNLSATSGVDEQHDAYSQFARQESDSFQEERREQFLRESIASTDKDSIWQETIRVVPIPGRSTTPKPYPPIIERLERRKTAHKTQPGAQSSSSSLQCTGCFKSAKLWCTACQRAYCLLCWNQVPRHVLYNEVPNYPPDLVRKVQKEVRRIETGYTTAPDAPAAVAVKTATAMAHTPMPLSREASPIQRPQEGDMQPVSSFAQAVQSSAPGSPHQRVYGNNVHFTVYPEEAQQRVQEARDQVAANAAAQRLLQHDAIPPASDGNWAPAKVPVVEHKTVSYVDYTVPGVVLTGRGQIVELNDDVSESLATSSQHSSLASPIPTDYRPLLGGGRKADEKRRIQRNLSPPRSASPPILPSAHDRAVLPSEQVDFQGQVSSSFHYVNAAAQLSPLVLTGRRAPPGFEHTDPHRKLVKKLSRESYRSLKKKGDTRVFTPSFSLGNLGGPGLAAGGGSGGGAVGSTLAATISRPSTVAKPLTGIAKDLVFPSSSSSQSMPQLPGTGNQITGQRRRPAAAVEQSPRPSSRGEGTEWKSGEFQPVLSDPVYAGLMARQRATTAPQPAKITIYHGVPVYTRDYRKEQQDQKLQLSAAEKEKEARHARERERREKGKKAQAEYQEQLQQQQQQLLHPKKTDEVNWRLTPKAILRAAFSQPPPPEYTAAAK